MITLFNSVYTFNNYLLYLFELLELTYLPENKKMKFLYNEMLLDIYLNNCDPIEKLTFFIHEYTFYHYIYKTFDYKIQTPYDIRLNSAKLFYDIKKYLNALLVLLITKKYELNILVLDIETIGQIESFQQVKLLKYKYLFINYYNPELD